MTAIGILERHGNHTPALRERYLGVEPWCAPAEPDTSGHLWRLILSAGCLGLLVVTLVAPVVSAGTVRSVAGSLYLLGGVGVAPLLLTRKRAPDSVLALAPAISLGWLITVGMVMAELGPWSPTGALMLTAVVSGPLHLFSVIRSAGALRRGAPTFGPIDASAICSVAGLVLTVGSSFSQRHLDPGPAGIFAVMPPTWYLGLVLLVAGLVLARHGPRRNAAIAAVGLVLALVTTPAIVYPEFQLPYAAKHLGVTNLILAHHGVSFNGDIYQAWPGLFAATAWMSKAVGIADPAVFARWWPVLIDLGILAAIRMLGGRLGLSSYRAWAAGIVFTLASTFDQAYFSPQSTAFLLALAVFAAAVAVPDETRRQHALRLGVALWLGLVTVVTHQITPYFVVGVLVVMVLFRLVRTWWLPLGVAVGAVAWAVAHRSLLGPFLSLSAIGNLAGNVAPPVHASTLGYEPIVTLTFDGAAATAVMVGLVAVIALARGRSLRHWGLALAAASAGTLLVASSYGGEAVFRVVLFAMPWLAILAMTLPVPRLLSRPRAAAAAWGTVLVVLVGIFVFTSSSLDWAHVVRPGALQAVRAYEQHAPAGSVVYQTGTADATPTDVTARYPRVSYSSRQLLDDLPDPHRPFDARADVNRFALDVAHTGSAPASYALVSQEIGAYDALYGLEQLGRYQAFTQAMAHSPRWQPVVVTPDATLYKLRPVPQP